MPYQPEEIRVLKALKALKTLDSYSEKFPEKFIKYSALYGDDVFAASYRKHKEEEEYSLGIQKTFSIKVSSETLLSMVEEPIDNPSFPDYRNCNYKNAMRLKPHGSLAGINFIYDYYDNHYVFSVDGLILQACYKLQKFKSILAIHGIRNQMIIFVSKPTFIGNNLLKNLETGGFEWNITQYFPIKNGWAELNAEMEKDMLIKQAAFMQKHYYLK